MERERERGREREREGERDVLLLLVSMDTLLECIIYSGRIFIIQ